ncbi:universal stress protein [Streptomyces sannanensis]|uniref:Universal stress protein n=1 Tax=Streptomyces sannanensis TaxID=285536 RepID=A0ABP6SN00_9ACTN
MDAHTAESPADGPVVVGTDGSPDAVPAVKWAAREAAARSQPLHIVHATGIDAWGGNLAPDTIRLVHDAAHLIVDEAAEHARGQVPDLRVTTTVSGDRPDTSLLGTAGDTATIVVGSRGLSGFPALLLGSVSLKVASHARGPVVVVRGTEQPPRGVVLAGLRDERDLEVARCAGRTAARRKAALHLVTAWTLPQYLESVALIADEARARAGEQATAGAGGVVESVRREFPDVDISDEVKTERSPANVLVEASSHADLLVVGARGPAHSIGALMGRVTPAVLHHAHCPVAVIPRG